MAVKLETFIAQVRAKAPSHLEKEISYEWKLGCFAANFPFIAKNISLFCLYKQVAGL
jgi:hypothetical protein